MKTNIYPSEMSDTAQVSFKNIHGFPTNPITNISITNRPGSAYPVTCLHCSSNNIEVPDNFNIATFAMNGLSIDELRADNKAALKTLNATLIKQTGSDYIDEAQYYHDVENVYTSIGAMNYLTNIIPQLTAVLINLKSLEDTTYCTQSSRLFGATNLKVTAINTSKFILTNTSGKITNARVFSMVTTNSSDLDAEFYAIVRGFKFKLKKITLNSYTDSSGVTTTHFAFMYPEKILNQYQETELAILYIECNHALADSTTITCSNYEGNYDYKPVTAHPANSNYCSDISLISSDLTV